MTTDAQALSCAQREGWTPEAVVTGREPRPPGDAGFFERYDTAIVGEVREVVANEDGGSPDCGLTRTTVAVAAAFGETPVGQTITLTSADPGWLNGYAFQAGRTYFIPVQHTGPDGKADYSHACDPIAEIDDPLRVDELTESARVADAVAVSGPGRSPADR